MDGGIYQGWREREREGNMEENVYLLEECQNSSLHPQHSRPSECLCTHKGSTDTEREKKERERGRERERREGEREKREREARDERRGEYRLRMSARGGGNGV